MGFREQRQTERFEVVRALEVRWGEATASGKTINLSLGGALIHVQFQPQLAMGEDVTVTFALPDLDAPVSVGAKVRWVDDITPERVGIQFTSGLRARETWALNRLFDSLRGRR